jgi:heme/copper-type cytochrome/quinol oxidase subunit 2
MSVKQKVVVWIGTLLIVAMGVYPPWVRIGLYDPIAATGGDMRMQAKQYVYGWIFVPPRAVGTISEETSGSSGSIPEVLSWVIELDVRRLLVQWSTVAFATLSLVWTLRQRS